MKLTKVETRDHEQIDTLLRQKALSLTEKELILDKFLPHSLDNSTKSGSFFTPRSISQEFSVFCDCDRDTVIDLAAGIGSLAHALVSCGRRPKKLVCVESNPDFVRIGKKVVPEAEWVLGDVFTRPVFDALRRRRANWVISNPPYGLRLKDRDWLTYNGASDLMAVETAVRLAPDSVFILPQGSVPWQDSGTAFHRERKDIGGALKLFMDRNPRIVFGSTSMDMSVYAKDWQGGSSKVELVHLSGQAGTTGT